MSRNRQTSNLFAITLLVLSALACQTIVKAISPDQSSSNPASNDGEVNLSQDWLVTAEELNSLSTDIGIIEWKLTQETPGENRICRMFQGVSWSVSPNEGLNCILKISQGSTFADVVDSMFKDGRLPAGAKPVNSNLDLDGEYALYAGDFPNGQGVFDLIVMKDNLVYWSSVTLGTPAGESPQSTYESASAVIDSFLANIVKINIERRK
jgi:hypothetical protein